MKHILTISLWLAAAVGHAQLESIRTLEPDDGQEVRHPIEALIFGSPVADHPALERELLDIFASSGTTLEGKQYACRMLRFCASDACVPVLAPKLNDPKLSAYVRLVLQGLDSPEVEKVLIAALPRAPQGVKAGIIGTLGQCGGSPQSVQAIRPYVKHVNTEIRYAAITALGNIGGMDAVRVLVQAKVSRDLENVRIRTLLKCAETLDEETAESAYQKYLQAGYDDEIRTAALIGLTKRLPEKSADLVLSLLTSDNARMKRTAFGLLDVLPPEKLTAKIDQMDPDLQLRVLGIVSGKQAAEAEGAVLRLADSDNPDVRDAAFRTLQQIGGEQTIEKLIALAPLEQGAFDALCGLQAEGTDAAVLQAAQTTDDDKVKSSMLNCLSQRRSPEALPLFIELAKGDWSRSCMAAIDGMAALVSEADFPVYAELLIGSDNANKTAALERSIAAAAQRMPDKEACAKSLLEATDRAEGDTRYAVIRALGGIGGVEAKKVLTEAAGSDDPGLQDAAVRGLASWPTIDAAPELLDIATSSGNEKHRVLALRGYIRLAGTMEDYEAAYYMCERAAAATDRPAELKAIISCVKRLHNQQVLDFLERLLDNREVFNEAGWAICEISSDQKIRKSSVSVLEKIARTASDKALAKRAGELAAENRNNS